MESRGSFGEVTMAFRVQSAPSYPCMAFIHALLYLKVQKQVTILKLVWSLRKKTSKATFFGHWGHENSTRVCFILVITRLHHIVMAGLAFVCLLLSPHMVVPMILSS